MKTLYVATLFILSILYSKSQTVISFSLINAETNEEIQVINDNDTIKLSETGNFLNIKANTEGEVACVIFDFNGETAYATENVAPYTLAGDNGGNYNAMSLTEGEYDITATPFTGKDGSGDRGQELTVSFFVVNDIQTKDHDNDFLLYFEEIDGLVVGQFESLPPADGWSFKTEKNDYTGRGYFEWLGGDKFNNPGKGLMEYKIKISNPGIYRFQWRSKVGKGSDPTEHNDTWLRIPDAKDFYAQKSNGHIVHPHGICTNDCPKGSGSNGWFKVYSSGTTQWTWSCRTSDHDPHQIYADFDTTGFYTIQISGRSNNHLLDRFVLYLKDSVSESVATNLNNPETYRTSGQVETYEVKFNIVSEDIPVQDAIISFFGYEKKTGEDGSVVFDQVLPFPELTYTITKHGFYDLEGQFDSISGNIEETIHLEKRPISDVTFIVTSDSVPVEGAKISFIDSIAYTDQNGQAVFRDIMYPGYSFVYKITKDGYMGASGRVGTQEDRTLDINLTGIVGIEAPMYNDFIKFFSDANSLFITGQQEISHLVLFSLSGRLISSKNIVPDKYCHLDISFLPKGLYFIQIRTINNTWMVKKFIK